MNQPLVSVVVPVYNVAQYLPKCLDSIVNQTYKNLEIILVNDGSTDNSLEIIHEYAKKDSRIMVIDQENGGLSDARNTGVKQINGEYIV
ncbi:MAG: glycosyltransferase family 2 protein, partial [Culicoidibacterales bacterium]